MNRLAYSLISEIVSKWLHSWNWDYMWFVLCWYFGWYAGRSDVFLTFTQSFAWCVGAGILLSSPWSWLGPPASWAGGLLVEREIVEISYDCPACHVTISDRSKRQVLCLQARSIHGSNDLPAEEGVFLFDPCNKQDSIREILCNRWLRELLRQYWATSILHFAAMANASHSYTIQRHNYWSRSRHEEIEWWQAHLSGLWCSSSSMTTLSRWHAWLALAQQLLLNWLLRNAELTATVCFLY